MEAILFPLTKSCDNPDLNANLFLFAVCPNYYVQQLRLSEQLSFVSITSSLMKNLVYIELFRIPWLAWLGEWEGQRG